MTARGWLIALILTGLVLRAGLWLVYEPIVAPDTASYMRTGTNFIAADFSSYDGRRTPGYPLVLALAGGSPRAVWALQMLAGLAISVLLFGLAHAVTGRPGFAMALGMSYNLNLSQLFFEANLLAETVSTLLLVAVVAGVALGQRARAFPSSPWLLVGLGALAGAAVLTRPQLVFLPPLLGVIAAAASLVSRRPLRAALARACLAALPGILMVLAWSSFNYARVGYFTLSTQMGIGLMNHTLGFIELAPDRYQTIRDIYVKHRDAKVAALGRHNANWDAFPELTEATGLPLPALSSQLTSLSVHMFLRHPVRYGVGVAQAWTGFWTAPIYWFPDRIRPPSLAVPLGAVWRAENVLLRLVNVAFLAACLAALISRAFRQRIGLDVTLTTIGTVVLAGSVVQALGEYGENGRYAIPMQSLIVVAVAIAAGRWLEAATAPAPSRLPLRDKRRSREIAR